MLIRVGTRGSDLALRQTNLVCQQLKAIRPDIEFEIVTIRTHGDILANREIDANWPAGAFVSAVENALLEGQVDVAVHSYKDLPTKETEGLVIAAIPDREVVHDVLLTRAEWHLEDLPSGIRIGTSSPRRKAQMLEIGNFEIIPIRGNVPARVDKIGRNGLDAVILAAAGLKRLGLDSPHRIELPVASFIPAPAQGALAVQVRKGDPAETLCALIDDEVTRGQVVAERALLRHIQAGCQAPVGALATIEGGDVRLHAKVFTEDLSRKAEGTLAGLDTVQVGMTLAEQLRAELGMTV